VDLWGVILGAVIEDFLKIALRHNILDWQENCKNISEKGIFSIF
jgi:hypothetical protein